MKKVILLALCGLSLVSCNENSNSYVEAIRENRQKYADSVAKEDFVREQRKQDSLQKWYATPAGKSYLVQKEYEREQEKKREQARLIAEKKVMRGKLISEGQQIWRHFVQNEVRAEYIYTGKNVEFAGRIDKIGKSFGQAYIIILYDGEIFTGLKCYGSDSDISNLSVGEFVKVSGTCKTKVMHVSIEDCTFERM